MTTSVGAPDANSFITLSEADDIIEAFGDDITTWDALEDEQKEFRLTLAAYAIGTSFPFRGYKAYEGQSLAFPRAISQVSYSRSSYSSFNYGSLSARYSSTPIPLPGTSFEDIPEDIKRAQAYIAYHVIHKNLMNRKDPSDSDVSSPSNMPVSSFSVRGISVSFKDTGGESFLLALDQLINDENSAIYLMLTKYISQVRFTNGGDKPTPLTYVPSSTTTTVTTTATTTSTTTTTGTTTTE